MNYVSPEVEILEMDLVDVIQTSPVIDPDDVEEPPVSGDNMTDIG